jgi:hypothetical protein
MLGAAGSVLTTLVLRQAGSENHFRVFDGGRYVGRIYQYNADFWFWSLALEVTEPATPPHGWHEPSREAAMARFKAAYLASS